LKIGLGRSLLNSYEQVGDVHAVQFPGESEVALFISGSGDVLLCDEQEWQRVRKIPALAPRDGVSLGSLNPPIPLELSPGDLESVLAGLGAVTA
jgi:hypothetical protein